MTLASSKKMPLQATALHELHRAHQAKMTPFAGYEMPLHYPLGIKQEHEHTRHQAGLFDVSHMGQIKVRGQDIAQALELLVPADLQHLEVGQQCYTLLTNQQGGIIDDLIITRRPHDWLLVVNAAGKNKVLQHLSHYLMPRLGPSGELSLLEEQALLALQGPAASQVMASLAPAIATMTFMTAKAVMLAGCDCWVSRSGYTGEDGFEISLPAEQADFLAKQLLAFAPVTLVGLGARDSLRLEAGLCLYGHDINSHTTPVEASLSWTIGQSRRSHASRPGGFLGADVVLSQLQNGVEKKRVGLRVIGKIPVREGALLLDAQQRTVGRVTSGGYGISLQTPIAMGYVSVSLAHIGAQLKSLVRQKEVTLEVVKMPFIAPHYYKQTN